MTERTEAEKIAKEYAVAEVCKNARLTIVRIIDEPDMASCEFDVPGKLPADCWYIFCDDDTTGLSPAGLCGNLNSERLICVSKVSGKVLLDEIIYTD